MNRNRVYFLVALIASLGFLAVAASAQDTKIPVEAATAPVAEQVSKTMATEELSIYGEVQSVDAQGTGSINVQYYDYDADDEKTINIVFDANTKLENASAITDIKKGDWADVTYSAAAGKNRAVSVIVEKDEQVGVTESSSERTASQEQAAVKGETAISEDIPY